MAGRYATALFELALEEHAIDAVKADLDRFNALVAESSDLQRLVRSPVFTAGEQTRALSAVLEKTGIVGLAARFLKLVSSNRRLFAAPDMIRGFRALVGEGVTVRERFGVSSSVTFSVAIPQPVPTVHPHGT